MTKHIRKLLSSLKAQAGFTLVELSIVLVIIGLIVSGIVGGQALVHSAQLRAVTSDVKDIRIAWRAFELEYNAIPGDMKNAHDYWKTDCTVDPDDCNGDGNNKVDGGWTATGELINVWRHFDLSKILPKKNPISASFRESSIVENARFYIYSSDFYGNPFTGHNFITLAVKGSPATKGALTTSDAQYIDDTMDDGNPMTGNVRGIDADISSPVDGTVDAGSCVSGGAYVTSSTGLRCRMFFLLD